MGEDRRACNSRLERGDIPLAQLATDPVEFAFLSAIRYFCLGFSSGDQSPIVTAILQSDSFFPVRNSADVMRGALAVVHEMRCSRRSIFRFSNPRCKGCSQIVTEHERHIVQMLQYIRRGETAKARTAAMILCEGNPTEDVIAETKKFSVLLPIVETRQFVH